MYGITFVAVARNPQLAADVLYPRYASLEAFLTGAEVRVASH